MSEIRELRRQYEEAEPVRINCGVYVRPRSFECWLGGQLNAANQRIKELIRDYAAMRIEASKEFFRAEAAERQRATVLTALTEIRKYIDNFDGSWDIDHIYGLVMYALAQIEQPQDSEAKTA